MALALGVDLLGLEVQDNGRPFIQVKPQSNSDTENLDVQYNGRPILIPVSSAAVAPPPPPPPGSGPGMYGNISGTWKLADAIYYKTGGNWKLVTNIYYKQGGVWKNVEP